MSPFRANLVVLCASLGVPGASLGALGPVLGALGAIWGALGRQLGRSWRRDAQSADHKRLPIPPVQPCFNTTGRAWCQSRHGWKETLTICAQQCGAVLPVSAVLSVGASLFVDTNRSSLVYIYVYIYIYI